MPDEFRLQNYLKRKSAGELDEVLRGSFAITPPAPPEEIFERTGG